MENGSQHVLGSGNFAPSLWSFMVLLWLSVKGLQRESPVTEVRKSTERSCISSAGWPPEVSVTNEVQGPR